MLRYEMSDSELNLTLIMKELTYLREKIQKTIEKVNYILNSTEAQKKDIESLNNKCLEALQQVNNGKWLYANSQDGS